MKRGEIEVFVSMIMLLGVIVGLCLIGNKKFEEDSYLELSKINANEFSGVESSSKIDCDFHVEEDFFGDCFLEEKNE